MVKSSYDLISHFVLIRDCHDRYHDCLRIVDVQLIIRDKLTFTQSLRGFAHGLLHGDLFVYPGFIIELQNTTRRVL